MGDTCKLAQGIKVTDGQILDPADGETIGLWVVSVAGNLWTIDVRALAGQRKWVRFGDGLMATPNDLVGVGLDGLDRRHPYPLAEG